MSRGFAFQSVEDRMETYEAIDKNPVARTLRHAEYAAGGFAAGSMTGDPKAAVEGAKAGWRVSDSMKWDDD